MKDPSLKVENSGEDIKLDSRWSVPSITKKNN